MTGEKFLHLYWTDYEELLENIERSQVDDSNAIKDLTEPFFYPNRYLMKLLHTLNENELGRNRLLSENQYKEGSRMLLRQFGGPQIGYTANPGEISICYDYSILCPFNDRQPLLNRLIAAGLHSDDFQWLIEYHPRLKYVRKSLSDTIESPIQTAINCGRIKLADLLTDYDAKNNL